MSSLAPLAPLAPTDEPARIRALDRLRGVALLGIAIANVRQLFLPWDIADLPLAIGSPPGLARADWALFHALVDMKFLTLFSLLFGVGFALQNERIVERGRGFAGIYLRRVLLLALFGIAHGLLLYPAEVLLPYAVGGLLLLALGRLSADGMLRVGLVLLGAATIWSYQLTSLGNISIGVTLVCIAALSACVALLSRRGWRQTVAGCALVVVATATLLTVRSGHRPGTGASADFAEANQALIAMTSDDATAWPEEYRVRREGSTVALIGLHAKQYAAILFYFAILMLWRTLGLFLIGAGLYRRGLFSETTDTPPDLWWRVTKIGLGIGLPLSFLATALHGRELSGLNDWRFPDFLHEASALLVAAGVAGAVFLSVRRGAASRRGSGFWSTCEAAGRMALTNYIGMSLVLAALAEPWGLGLYGRFGGPVLTALAVAVFVVLALASRAWLGTFRLGPLEWLWRCGTYGRWLPNHLPNYLPNR